jgi:cell division protein FtsB
MDLTAHTITTLHDQANAAWHAMELDQPGVEAGDVFLLTVVAQHRANYDLWHTEDIARKPDANDSEIADAKRLIDKTNQRRNDLAEQLDELLLAALPANASAARAELHSETPGLIIDRLSILSLKLYHTREEIDRPNAPSGHAERNRARLSVLQTQRDDLSSCLDRLWGGLVRGERRFHIYRQLKMYNDPTLNPALYNASTST